MIYIGIAGKAGAGKDTIADYVVDEYNFEIARFADPLKELLNDRFGWFPSMWEDRQWKDARHPLFGQNSQSGEAFSPRSWAQWLGTDVVRKYDRDFWVRAFAKKNKDKEYLVIPDVRFENEADFIRRHGHLIHVCRDDGYSPDGNLHLSESGLQPQAGDQHIANNGSYYALYEKIDRIMGMLLEKE